MRRENKNSSTKQQNKYHLMECWIDKGNPCCQFQQWNAKSIYVSGDGQALFQPEISILLGVDARVCSFILK